MKPKTFKDQLFTGAILAAMLVMLAFALTGCGTVLPLVAAAQEDAAAARKGAASVRHQVFCNQSAGAALERYRSTDDRKAFMQLCDTPAAQ